MSEDFTTHTLSLSFLKVSAPYSFLSIYPIHVCVVCAFKYIYKQRLYADMNT